MHLLGVSSNIMSLGGLALAIGVLVDASIVMVENGYRRLSEYQEQHPGPVAKRRSLSILIEAAKQVGPALFFSLLIIVVSFLPVFLLEAQEGRMFRPLAWTKTLAVGSSSILAITLGAGTDDNAHSRPCAAGARKSGFALHASSVPAGAALLFASSYARDIS